MNSVVVKGLSKGTYAISELLDLDDMAELSRIVVKGRKRKDQKFPKTDQ